MPPTQSAPAMARPRAPHNRGISRVRLTVEPAQNPDRRGPVVHRALTNGGRDAPAEHPTQKYFVHPLNLPSLNAVQVLRLNFHEVKVRSNWLPPAALAATVATAGLPTAFAEPLAAASVAASAPASGSRSSPGAPGKPHSSVALDAPCRYDGNVATSGNRVLQCRNRRWAAFSAAASVVTAASAVDPASTVSGVSAPSAAASEASPPIQSPHTTGVQRFGGLNQLVNQTIDPLVASWFKNTAQSRTATQLVHDRITIQDEAVTALREGFARYDLELVDVVLGTPFGQSIEPVLEQLRASQIAKEQVKAYGDQKEAAGALRDLNDTRAQAEAQGDLTRSAIDVEIAGNRGEAEVKMAEQQAKQIRALAEANAEAAKLQGHGEGERLAAIGKGEADATRARFEAAGSANNGLMLAVFSDFANAVREGKLQVVPHTLISSGAEAGSANALMQLWTALSAQRIDNATDGPVTSVVPAVTHAARPETAAEVA